MKPAPELSQFRKIITSFIKIVEPYCKKENGLRGGQKLEISKNLIGSIVNTVFLGSIVKKYMTSFYELDIEQMLIYVPSFLAQKFHR